MTSKSGFTHVIETLPFRVGTYGTTLAPPPRSSRGGDGKRQSSGSAKANIALPWPAPSIPGRKPSVQAPQPVGTTTYCRPSTLYVDGLLWWPLPHWNCQSSSPLRASSALNSPVGSPPNTRSPPVASTEPHIGMSLAQRHVSFPVRGSKALIDP